MMPFVRVALALMVMAAGSLAVAQANPAAPDGKEGGLQRYVEAQQPGWNLGNTFDAVGGDETAWGNPRVTKELIDRIAASGFKSIRIPITWSQRMGPAPEYTIRPEFIARIKEVVGWAMDAKLYVMINMHHDSGWVQEMPKKRQEVQARFDATWKQLAREFRDYPLTVMFEGINEPKFSDDWGKESPEYYELLDALNTSFHTIVRASGGNNATRPLVLESIAASNTQARFDELSKTMQKLNDPNLIASFHYYGFWPFSVNIAGGTTFDEKAQKDLTESFDRAYNTFVARGIPVIVGECGLLGFDKNVNVVEHGESMKYFEFLSYYAREKKQTLVLWDNGQHYDRRAMQWRDPLLVSEIVEGTRTRSAVAQSDLVFLRKSAEVGDVEVPLMLHGNTLEKIALGGKQLQAGTDYSVNGERLTIKAATLRPFAGGEFGQKATLVCEFSAGANWPIHVLYADRPVLKAAEGKAASFAIPTAFNGDRLATMEAVYVAGGNAGPANWTPFKEFATAFNPEYEAGAIRLTPAFFKEVKDGQTRLKLHFWSGEVMNYLITRQGEAVSGAAE